MKSGSTALSRWLPKLENLELQVAFDRFRTSFNTAGIVGLFPAELERMSAFHARRHPDGNWQHLGMTTRGQFQMPWDSRIMGFGAEPKKAELGTCLRENQLCVWRALFLQTAPKLLTNEPKWLSNISPNNKKSLW